MYIKYIYIYRINPNSEEYQLRERHRVLGAWTLFQGEVTLVLCFSRGQKGIGSGMQQSGSPQPVGATATSALPTLNDSSSATPG